MKRKVLLAIVLIGLFFRFYHLFNNFFFGYDQGRDLQRIYSIVHDHKLKLVGPETDIPGVFNGPLMYYLLLPFYALSNFNPNAAAIFFILFNALGILLIYICGKELFNEKVGLLSALFWSVSYLIVSYGRYLSNTGMMPVTTLLFFLGVMLYTVKKKEIGLPISIIGLALSIHVAFYFIYLVFIYLIYWPRVKVGYWLKTIVLGLFLLSSFIISEFKFKFIATRSLLAYFLQQGQIAPNITNVIGQYLQTVTRAVNYSFFSFNYVFAFLLFTAALIFFAYSLKKEKKAIVFILVWFFSTVPLFAFQSGVVNGPSILSSTLGAAIIIVSYVIYRLWMEKRKILAASIFTIVILSNLFLFLKDNFKAVSLFAYQPIFYRDEKQLIDYTYKQAVGEPFSVCGLTNPLFINTLWSSLYKIYGEPRFGYLPYWSGQIQYLNPTYLSYDKSHVQLRYIIIEPPTGITETAKKTIIYLEDKVSVLDEEKQFGKLIVQKRHLPKKNEILRDNQKLTAEDIDVINMVNVRDPRYSCFVNYN